MPGDDKYDMILRYLVKYMVDTYIIHKIRLKIMLKLIKEIMILDRDKFNYYRKILKASGLNKIFFKNYKFKNYN